MPEPTPQTMPQWIWPRADSHIVLGAARSIDVLKTFVEPGGSFSPGVGSFGVSVWVWLPAEKRLLAPELLPREALRDRLLGGSLPLARSRWRAGSLELDLRLGADGCPDRHNVLDTLWARVVNRGSAPVEATVLLVVRSAGPAGGPVRAIAYDPELPGFRIRDAARVLAGTPPTRAGCSAPAEGELSLLLRRGAWPTAREAFDKDGWCGGYLAYDIHLAADETWEAWWDFPVLAATANPTPEVVERLRRPGKQRLDELADRWREELSQVHLEAPDGRIPEAFTASLTHLVMAHCGDEPRIATVCYPLLWTRDTIYIVNALDKAGLTQWSRPGLERLLDQPWAGGFGPEADAPGQVLWALGEHVRLTGERAWLADRWDRVTERVEWLKRLRRATEPVRSEARNILPTARLRPDHELIADAAVNGLINGRMDWHRPLFYVNAFALAGLRSAAALARLLERDDEAADWAAEAADLGAALSQPTARFGQNERDWAAAVWPTGALDAADPEVHHAFERWWRRTRYDARGRYHGESRWRYFEIAQAHNLLRLGMRHRSQLTLEQYLRTQNAPGLYAWAEGDATGDPTGDWRLIRGWWPTGPILPHGWCSAEMALLLRDMFLFEEGDRLVLGAGVQADWLGRGPLACENAPTFWGRVSWRLETVASGRFNLTVQAAGPPPGGYRLRLPLPPSAVVEVDGAGIREEAGDWPLPADRPELTVLIAIP